MFNQVISAYGEPKFILGLYQVKPGILACTYNPRRAQGQQPRLVSSRPA